MHTTPRAIELVSPNKRTNERTNERTNQRSLDLQVAHVRTIVRFSLLR